MSTVDVQESIHIPAREGRGVQLKAGQRFRCIDVEGKQCGDLFAFCSDNIREYQSAEHTRVWNDDLFPASASSSSPTAAARSSPFSPTKLPASTTC